MIEKKEHTIQLSVRINENSPLELVIGRDSIRNNNLAGLFASVFFGPKHLKNMKDTSIRPQETCTHVPRTGKSKRKRGPCTHSPNTVNCKNKCTTEPIEHNPAVELITLPDTTTPVQPLTNQAALAPQPMPARLEPINDTPLTDRCIAHHWNCANPNDTPLSCITPADRTTAGGQ